MAVAECVPRTTIALYRFRDAAMNITFDQGMTLLVVAAGLLSALSILFRRDKSNSDVLFAIFCGSVAMAMLRPSLQGQSAWLLWCVTLASCATCNIYWLFSRNLFRGEQGVETEEDAGDRRPLPGDPVERGPAVEEAPLIGVAALGHVPHDANDPCWRDGGRGGRPAHSGRGQSARLSGV